METRRDRWAASLKGALRGPSPPQRPRLQPVPRTVWGDRRRWRGRGREEKSSPEGTSGSWSGLRACRGEQRGGRRAEGRKTWGVQADSRDTTGLVTPCPAAPRPPRRWRDLSAGDAGLSGASWGRAKAGERSWERWAKPGKALGGDGLKVGARAAVWSTSCGMTHLCPARRLQGSIPSPKGETRKQSGPWLRWTGRWFGVGPSGPSTHCPNRRGELVAVGLGAPLPLFCEGNWPFHKNNDPPPAQS